MRSLLIILATMLVLAGGFFVYFWLQPDTRVLRPETNVKIAPLTQPSSYDGSATQPTIREGEGAWLKHFDDKTLALSYEFRGKTFTPQKNGTVDVDQPQARFYLDHGRLLTIEGKNGNCVMESGTSPMESKTGATQMPSRGELHDVIMKLYPSVDAPKPSLICTMNNANFDNDTFSISTAAYVDANGVNVPADQVKVEVRGDYEFDGRGLTIRWNQRDRHLQTLEIAHGERLLVKDPSAINKTFGEPSTNPSESDAKVRPVAQEQSAEVPKPAPTAEPAPTKSGAKGAAAKKKKASEAAAPAPPPPIEKPVRIDPIYRATFNDDVNVYQAVTASEQARVATCDVMNVDFMTSDKHKGTTQPVAPPAPPPTSRPTTRRGRRPATNRAAAARAQKPVTLPTTPAPAPVTLPVTLPTSKPTSEPTTKRATIFAMDSEQTKKPMLVTWVGKLRIATMENLEDPPADSKDSVVRMIGIKNKVELKNDQDKSVMHGALVSFHTGRQDGYVRGSDAYPIVDAKDKDGATIHAPSIQYSNSGQLATIPGPSYADLPIPDKPDQKMHAEWSKVAKIYMASAGPDSQKLVIQRATFDGDVHIHRPEQLDLQSAALELTFDPPQPTAAPSATTQDESKQPELREMLATGNVRTELTDDSGKVQNINCDKLALNTKRDAAGKLYPHIVKAIGNVYAKDPQQVLQAGELNLVLRPSTRPSSQPSSQPTTQDFASTAVELEQMDATDNVRITTTSGSTAHGDHLTVKGNEGERLVDLIGTPTASVGDKNSSLEGKMIHFEEATQKVEVNSPGHMHAIQQQQGATTRPIDVVWQQNLEVQGKQNIVDVYGGVVITSDTPNDETIAKGNHVHLILADKPPTTKPSEEAESTTKPANGSPMNAFGDKTVKSVRLEENVTVNAKQTSATDITKVALFSPVLNYNMDEKMMVIDRPGRMLYQQNLLSETTQPATGPSAQATTAPTSQSATTQFATTQVAAPVVQPSTSQPTTEAIKAMGGDLSNMHGATAFEWQKEFRYDETKMQAQMTGDVRLVHFPTTDLTGPSVELDAQTVIADMEQRPTTEPATQPTSQPEQKVRIRNLVADGDVSYRSDKLHFDAQHLEFNPNTHMLIATGTERNPAELHEAEGFSNGTFTELRMNTVTEEMEVRGFQAQIRRAKPATATSPAEP